MDKSINARRKAQQLARNGEFGPACEEMRRLLAEPDADPYDHVYLGDLLHRTGNINDALAEFEEAAHTYGRLGLHRNAIAVCKKILRLDGGRHRIRRLVGELYVRENLQSEALPYLLGYLDAVSKEGGVSEDFLATLEMAASASGLKAEVALRLADLNVRAGRRSEAASLLRGQADQCELAGSAELADSLREQARRLMGVSDDASVRGERRAEQATAPCSTTRPASHWNSGTAAFAIIPRRTTPSWALCANNISGW